MNLVQLRTTVRESLHAGKDTTNYVPEDLFWTDGHINYLLNEAYKHIQKLIRRSTKDYFSRFVKSTDSVFTALNQRFTPSTLKITAGVGSYRLPPDFVRMVLIRDLRTDKQARFRFVRANTEEFRQVYNEVFPPSDGSFLCDILGGRTLLVRPLPSEDFDIEIVYDHLMDPLSDYATGTITVAKGTDVVTFVGADLARFVAENELLLSVPIGDVGGRVDLGANYSVIASINIPSNQVTLAAPYNDGDVAGGAYIYSSVPLIPASHHDILVTRAVILAMSKGKNPHLDAIALWNGIYEDQLAALLGDVEIIQTSDNETSEAFMEDDY